MYLPDNLFASINLLQIQSKIATLQETGQNTNICQKELHLCKQLKEKSET